MFFSTTSLACSMPVPQYTLQEIASNSLNASLIRDWTTEKCQIQSWQKTGNTYFNRFWVFTTTKLYNAYEQTTDSETKSSSDQQEILNQSHRVTTHYDVKDENTLKEFENIKNRFSAENISLCIAKYSSSPFDQLEEDK